MSMTTDPSSSTIKRSTFQMRINPELKRRAEEVYAQYGLNLTDAINIFLQESIHENGLPFLLSPQNMEYKRAKAMRYLMDEVEKGWQSAEAEGWLTLDEVEAQLGASDA